MNAYPLELARASGRGWAMPDAIPPRPDHPRLTGAKPLLDWMAAHDFALETFVHPPHHTVEEAQAWRAGRGMQGGFCKNLFLKDKKGRLWLIVTLESRALKLNSLSKPLGSARLSFASADLLWQALGVRPGSVTPFAAINDTAGLVRVVLDAPMLEHGILHYHPLENTATSAISREDLLRFLRQTGHEPIILDLEEATQTALTG